MFNRGNGAWDKTAVEEEGGIVVKDTAVTLLPLLGQSVFVNVRSRTKTATPTMTMAL